MSLARRLFVLYGVSSKGEGYWSSRRERKGSPENMFYLNYFKAFSKLFTVKIYIWFTSVKLKNKNISRTKEESHSVGLQTNSSQAMDTAPIQGLSHEDGVPALGLTLIVCSL